MKSFIFYREFYSTVPGMEVDLYKSDDLNGSWISWRACLEAVLVDQEILYPEDSGLIPEHDLERLAIEHDIYCSVEDV